MYIGDSRELLEGLGDTRSLDYSSYTDFYPPTSDLPSPFLQIPRQLEPSPVAGSPLCTPLALALDQSSPPSPNKEYSLLVYSGTLLRRFIV